MTLLVYWPRYKILTVVQFSFFPK